MAATLVLSVSTAAGPTVTDSVTGIDLESADNALNTLANRQANPITVGTNSYEKWVRLKITAAPANYVKTTLFFTGAWVTYQLGTTATSTIANAVATSFTAATKAIWDTTTYSTTNSYTKYLALQLAVGATAGPGNWTQQTVNYSYDEA